VASDNSFCSLESLSRLIGENKDIELTAPKVMAIHYGGRWQLFDESIFKDDQIIKIVDVLSSKLKNKLILHLSCKEAQKTYGFFESLNQRRPRDLLQHLQRRGLRRNQRVRLDEQRLLQRILPRQHRMRNCICINHPA
jgi:hypothetical protein